MKRISLFLMILAFQSFYLHVIPRGGETGWRNPLALNGSGIGRAVSRWLTDQADIAFHSGAKSSEAVEEDVGPIVKSFNPLGAQVDRLANRLSLTYAARHSSGRISPAQARQSLQRTEFWLRTAFELDPSNFRAYDAYYNFLTVDVRETEFGKVDVPYYSGTQQDRHDRALAITRRASESFRLKGVDPEQYLGAALAWLNYQQLLAPDIKQVRQGGRARREYIRVSEDAARHMTELLAQAEVIHQKREKTGEWQSRSQERQVDYTTTLHFIASLRTALERSIEREKRALSLESASTT